MWITATLACICEHSWHNRWSASIKHQHSPHIRLFLSGVTPFSRALHHFPGSVMLPNWCRTTHHMTQSSREARKDTAEAHAPDGLNRHVPGSIHMCGRTASPRPCTHQAHNLRRGRGARRAGPASHDIRNIDGGIDEQRGGQRLRQHARRGHDADLPDSRTGGVTRARIDDVMVENSTATRGCSTQCFTRAPQHGLRQRTRHVHRRTLRRGPRTSRTQATQRPQVVP